jgi:transposase
MRCGVLATLLQFCPIIRHSKGLRSFYDRVMGDQKSRKKIAIVAVARKLLSIMRAMLLSGELFNEELVNKIDELTEAA